MNALLQTANELVPHLLALLAKGAAICMVATAIAVLLRRSSASGRHLVWTCAAVALATMPVLSVALPAWRAWPDWQGALSPPAESRAVGPVASMGAVRGSIADVRTAPLGSPQPASEVVEAPRWSLHSAGADGAALAATRISKSPSADVSVAPAVDLSWESVVVLVWGTGVLLFFVQIVGQLAALRRLSVAPSPELERAVHALSADLPRLHQTRLVGLPAGSMPMTWGLLRPTLALPADAAEWPAERLAAVLQHELAHIARHDWAWLVVARLAQTLHWPNPLAWFVAARLAHEQERACDDRVLASGTPASDYASHLLAVVQSTRPTLHAGIAMARPSQVESRLVAILDASRRRAAPSRGVVAFALLLLCLVALPIAALSAAAPSSVPPSQPTTLSTRPTTVPSLVDTQYRELPFPPIVSVPQDLPVLGNLPAKHVAIRVLDVDGKPVRIDRIIEAYFAQPNNGKWYNGESYDIFGRFADGWVAIDAGLYPTFINEKTPEIVFWSDGVPITARGSFVGKQRIECRLTQAPAGIGVDLREGPADVSIDEVAGRVVDPAGRPVAGAIVSLPKWDFRSSKPSTYREPVVTDADGVFRFPDFARQWYVTCTVEAKGYATRYLTTLPVGRPFTVRLDDRTRLTGDLAKPDGKAAANASVTLVSRRSTWRQMIVSVIDDVTQTISLDQAGRYDALVEPGEYDVRIRSESGVARHAKFVVRAGETQAFPRELTEGITARIRVLNSITRRPIEGFRLFIEEPGTSPLKARAGTDVTTDADGRAEWKHLTQGTELAYADLSGKYARWSSESAVQYDYLPGTDWLQFNFRSDMPELVILVEPAMAVTGTLVDPDGKPVAKAWVNVANLQTGDKRYATRTDEAGQYTMYLPDRSSMRSVDPNVAASQPWGLPVQVVAADPSKRFGNAISEPFDIRAGETHEVKLTLMRGGTVSGRVVDKDGKPVARIEVEAIIDDDSDTYYLTPRTLTDEDGGFTFPALRPGKYYVVADVAFGINRSVNPQWDRKRRTVNVQDGQTLSDLVINHDGPPPPPVPADYEKWIK
jgi:beta-lactamase regulating signal transducer with metallopeptidase domain/protocatechuate 3,4-dioxygenase beta subunit